MPWVEERRIVSIALRCVNILCLVPSSAAILLPVTVMIIKALSPETGASSEIIFKYNDSDDGAGLSSTSNSDAELDFS